MTGIEIIAVAALLLAEPAASTVDVAPPLPTGRLQLVSGNTEGANFLALDTVARTEGGFDFWFYNAAARPFTLAPGKVVVQMLEHGRISCRNHTYVMLFAGGYDSDGSLLVSLPEKPVEAISTGDVQDYIAKVLCDGVELPASNTVMGHRRAMEITLQILGHPKD